MTITARAIEDGGEGARRPSVRLNGAAWINGRVRARGTNELSGGEDDGKNQCGLLQSFAHGSSLVSWDIERGYHGLFEELVNLL